MGGETKYPHGPNCACVRLTPQPAYKARLRALWRFYNRQILLSKKVLKPLESAHQNNFPDTTLTHRNLIRAYQDCQRELVRLFPEIDFTPARKK